MTNPGIKFDCKWIRDVHVNMPAVKKQVESLLNKRTVKKEWQVAWLVRALTCIDLTTLCGDDTFSNVQRLCFKAVQPLPVNLIENLGLKNEDIHVAAVCVYPARVPDCKQVLTSLRSSLPIAAVATGFPSGQFPLEVRLKEIEMAVADGANEIDIVINRSLALSCNWSALYNEVKLMKEACGENVHMKTILATGELGSLTNVYRASMVCMMAGADFIKTSTGKENVNATLPVGMVMLRAIKDYYTATGYEVGFKPAGGIRTAKDAMQWQILIKETLGDKWLFPKLFRFGASGLLSDIERQIFHYMTGCYASTRTFSYC